MILYGLLFMVTFGSGSIDVSTMGVSPVNTASHQFTYDATESKGKRKTPKSYNVSEDNILNEGRRAKLNANTQDLMRNFAICGWMVRRHLDYVATFDLQVQTEDQEFNDYLESKVDEWSKPENFSKSKRHRRAKAVRLAEALAVLRGDHAWAKFTDGRVQGIESDRIKNPNGVAGEWIHGVLADESGAALSYAIHKRTKTGLQFERVIPAKNLLLHGYYDREDQLRGISPLASAADPMRDVYENSEYALRKMKVSQIFGMVINRAATESIGVVDEENPEEESPERKKYNVDFGMGPLLLDMEPGEEAKFLENKTPSSEFREFAMLTIQIAMKSLDIPYSFFDESHTNFFGSRGAWLHYERACQDKRESLACFQSDWLRWRMLVAFLNDELKLPKGMDLNSIPFTWVPRGMPWWKPSEEINGDVQSIAAGINNPERVCRERGTGDVYENMRITGKVIAFKKRLEKEYKQNDGIDIEIPLSFVPVPQQVQVVAADEVKNANS